MNYWISKEGFKNLQEKKERLLKEIELAQKRMGWHADLDKDLRENPGFMQARVKLVHELPYELREVSSIIFKCKIIEESEEYKNYTCETAQIGARVGLLWESGEKEYYFIAGYNESDLSNNIISYTTPLAETILGKKIGDEIEFKPNSGIKKFTIFSIEKGL